MKLLWWRKLESVSNANSCANISDVFLLHSKQFVFSHPQIVFYMNYRHSISLYEFRVHTGHFLNTHNNKIFIHIWFISSTDFTDYLLLTSTSKRNQYNFYCSANLENCVWFVADVGCWIKRFKWRRIFLPVFYFLQKL